MKMAVMERCVCSAQPKLETITSLKYAFLHRGPMTVYRVVCPLCGEGRFKLQGEPTREKAIAYWNEYVKIIMEVAAEYG